MDTLFKVIEIEVRPVGADEEDDRLAIVGGVAVNRGNVPWQVNLGGVGVMCGGTIVAMDVSFCYDLVLQAESKFMFFEFVFFSESCNSCSLCSW